VGTAVGLALAGLTYAALRHHGLEGNQVVVLWLVPPAFVAAYIGGVWPGLAATGAAVAASTLLCAPEGSFDVASSIDVQRIELLAATGIVMSLTIERLHRTMARLRSEQTRLTTMFHASPVAKALSRIDDRVTLEVNAAFTRTFGISRDEIIGRTPAEAGIMFDAAALRSMLGALREDRGLCDVEVEMRTRDGRTLAVKLSSEVVTIDGERHAISTFIDVTAYKHAVAAARDADVRLHELASVVDAHFWACEVGRRRMLLVSPGYERSWGRRRDEHMADPLAWADGVHPEDRPALVARAKAGYSDDEGTMEFRIVRPDGETRWVSARRFPIRDESGAIVRLAGACEDITKRKQAELNAQASEARFRELAAAVDDVFWLVDAATRDLLYISPAYERIWGRSIAELDARPDDWLSAVHPEDVERIAAAWSNMDTGTYDERFRIVRTDGTTRWVHDRAFRVLDEHGDVKRIAGIAKDITDERRLQDNLQQAQKLESIGLLAGGVAHDFNNILCVITANTDVLRDLIPPGDQEAQGVVAEVQLAAERATSLTRQLLAFGRKQVVKPVVLELNQAVEEARKMLQRVLGEDVAMRVSLDPALSPVRIDPGQITQVLLNLCVNARDAVGAGGEITIETVAEHDRALLVVRDNGCGMPEDVLARVFEPFFTTKDVGRGTGLGLAVVHGIIEQAGGTVRVESAPGRGTSFYISLPTITGTAESVITNRIPRDAQGECILLVDDDTHLRASASRSLRRCGYSVLEASDGADALRVLQEYGEEIDLLITDVVMPLMSGRELTDIALQTLPELRVLYTSGYTDDEIMRRGISQDEVEFLEKPFGSQALAAKVRDLLRAPAAPRRPAYEVRAALA